MKHALRKYLSPCGSALFMVVSTMAALTVLVTAMYMSVLSSRQVQYATFDQEQAYVTSTSVADIFTAYISDSKNASTTIMKKISTMKAGQTITTNGNDFAAFGGTKEDSAIGAYTVDIKRLNNETISGVDWNVYDIAVTVQKNGVAETTHSLVRSKNGEPTQMEPIDRFFTSTGYLPNDVWISSITTDSTVYCDNEYTVFAKDKNAAGDGDVMLNMDIICAGGALFNDKSTFTSFDEPLTWVFGNNLTIGKDCTASTFELGKSTTERGKIIVGGDMIASAYGSRDFGEYTDVYVLGDLYIEGNPISFKGNLYVKGDIIVKDSNGHKFSSLYLNGTMKSAVPGGTVHTGELVLHDMTTNKDVFNDAITESTKILDNRIGGSVFPKWQAKTSGLTENPITFRKCGTADAKYIHYIKDDCTIGTVRDVGDGSDSPTNFTIILDTGDDPNNVLTIGLSGNVDNDGDGKYETFMWFPDTDSSRRISVVIVGRGSVVIDVPDGVTYQATDREFFGHIAWFMMGGGSIKYTDSGVPYFEKPDDLYIKLNESIQSGDFILKTPDGTCSYTKVGTGDDAVYTCSSHGGSYEAHNVEKVNEGKKDSLCRGRILRSKVDAFYASHSSIKSNIVEYYTSCFGESLNGSSGYSSDCYYPNVNAFVISVLENADIQLGVDKMTKDAIMQNVFCGYVYAPYMTYVCVGSGGGGVKNVGGMIVSDIALSGPYNYVFAQPERTISQISGEDMDSLQPSGSRVWRVHGY